MGRNLRLSAFKDLELLYSETHKTDPRTARSALASPLPLPTPLSHPRGRLYPPPRMPFPTFFIFQIGANSSLFKALLRGGNSQLPSATPSFPILHAHLIQVCLPHQTLASLKDTSSSTGCT